MISNEKLYEKTVITKWSTIIRQRRLYWLGHLMRFDKQTPVRKALNESLLPVQRKRGRPRLTWTNTLEKDLAASDIKLNLYNTKPERTIKTIERLAEDISLWKQLMKDIMSSQ